MVSIIFHPYEFSIFYNRRKLPVEEIFPQKRLDRRKTLPFPPLLARAERLAISLGKILGTRLTSF